LTQYSNVTDGQTHAQAMAKTREAYEIFSIERPSLSLNFDLLNSRSF